MKPALPVPLSLLPPPLLTLFVCVFDGDAPACSSVLDIGDFRDRSPRPPWGNIYIYIMGESGGWEVLIPLALSV